MEEWGKPFFFSLFRSHLLFEDWRKGLGGEDGLIFVLFLDVFERRMGGSGEEKFLYFSFFLLFGRRKNGKIRFFFRLGFSF